MPPAVVQKAILSIQKLMFQDVPKGSTSNIQNMKSNVICHENTAHVPKKNRPDQIPISLFPLHDDLEKKYYICYIFVTTTIKEKAPL